MNYTSIFYKNILIIFSFLLFSSCAFNNKFFHPAKIDGDPSSEFSYSMDTVRTYIKMNPKNLQPLLIKRNDSLIKFGFHVESVKFKSANDNMLNGWIMKPKEGKPKATILHFHGSAGFIYSQYESIAPLIDLGYQVFTFDYSGFGFSEGKANRKNVIIDANSALDFIKNHPEFKGNKVVIYGQSLGGYIAAIVGTDRQADINGIVIEGAYTSHREMAVHQSPFWGNFVKKSRSAVHAIQSYKKPLLIIHSNEDKRVPMAFGKKIFNEANTKKEFYEIDNFHIGGLQFYAIQISNKIESML